MDVSKKGSMFYFFCDTSFKHNKRHSIGKLPFKIVQERLLKLMRRTLVRYSFCNKTLGPKMKVEILHKWSQSHITKHLLTSISVDIRIYLPDKNHIHLGLTASVNIIFVG